MRDTDIASGCLICEAGSFTEAETEFHREFTY